jgi:hypothetical protein
MPQHAYHLIAPLSELKLLQWQTNNESNLLEHEIKWPLWPWLATDFSQITKIISKKFDKKEAHHRNRDI